MRPPQGASFGVGFALVAAGCGEGPAPIFVLDQASDTRRLRVVGGNRFSLRADCVEGSGRGVWRYDFHGSARPSGRSTTVARRDGSGAVSCGGRDIGQGLINGWSRAE